MPVDGVNSIQGQIVVRRRMAGPNNASVHDDLTEVYQFIAGGGTFVTGGTIPGYKSNPPQ